jgi:hypothetical protein
MAIRCFVLLLILLVIIPNNNLAVFDEIVKVEAESMKQDGLLRAALHHFMLSSEIIRASQSVTGVQSTFWIGQPE